ncbi:hypothetical protein [Moorena producens]|uniref:hypothetical protein n=1 Tax=Moorena producens TaxID=1155739 RepID=UPI003C772696
MASKKINIWEDKRWHHAPRVSRDEEKISAKIGTQKDEVIGDISAEIPSSIPQTDVSTVINTDSIKEIEIPTEE